jgi:hypothetical protein
MVLEKDRKFLPIGDRADMRVILAAELGRYGADKGWIDAMDGMVREGAADVFVSDDNDEVIMLRIGADCLIVVTESGFLKIPCVELCGRCN